MALITFQTQNPIPQKLFEEFFSKELCQNEFFWFTEYDDDFFKATENQDDDVVHIRFEKFAESGFCYYYEIWSIIKDLNIDEETAILKRLAQYTQMQIMVSDDERAFFLWQVIDVDGNSFTGEFDDDTLNLLCCESTSVASFYTQNLLSTIEENQLKQLFQEFYPQIFLEYEQFNLSDNSDLVKIFGEEQLTRLTHFYKIYPVISKTWKSQKAKSDIAISVFKQWQDFYSEMVLLFPADYEQMESVKGGCDSREYCVVLSNGKSDRIEYKQPKDCTSSLNSPSLNCIYSS